MFFMLSDPQQDIVEFVEAVFIRLLKPRDEKLYQNHILEVCCGLNSLTKIKKYSQCAKANCEFNYGESVHKLFVIYGFMLRYMSMEQKVVLVQKIVQDVIGVFTEFGPDPHANPLNVGSNDSPTAQVILDCLHMLSCKEMAVVFSNKARNNAAGAGDGGAAEAAAAAEDAAKAGDAAAEELLKEKLAQAAKKGLMENVFPVLTSLYS